MNIFLTGGTGFIGSHVLKQVGAFGMDVTAIRRQGSQPRIKLDNAPRWIEKPLDELDENDISGHDVLMHLASAGVSPQKATLEEMMYWNVTVTGKLLELAAKTGIRRIIVAGSYAEYGLAANRYDYIPANASLEPTSMYAATKAAACMLSFSIAAQYGIELCYLRIFSAYGEGQNENNFFPSLCRSAKAGNDFPMTSGAQVRDFIHVEDVARILLKTVTMPDVIPGCPYVANVATGQPLALKDFAELWWRKLGARGRLLVGAIPYRSVEPMRFVAASPIQTNQQIGGEV